MIAKTTMAVLILGLTSLLASCNRTGVFSASSPSGVVRTVYMNCNSGQYSQVEPLLTADFQKLVHSELGAANGGIKGMCDHNTRHGSITSVDVVKEEVIGEGATVVVNIHFKNGAIKNDDKNSLVREQGTWKLNAGD